VKQRECSRNWLKLRDLAQTAKWAGAKPPACWRVRGGGMQVMQYREFGPSSFILNNSHFHAVFINVQGTTAVELTKA